MVDVDLIPVDELTVADIAAIVKKAKDAVLAAASKKGFTDMIIRDAMPKDDFGFNLERWENQTAIATVNAWAKDWSKELPAKKFVVFYKLWNTTPSPLITGLKIQKGGAGARTYCQLNLEELYLQDTVLGYLDHPEEVVLSGTDTIYVAMLAPVTVAQYGEKLGLGAFVCEPAGESVK